MRSFLIFTLALIAFVPQSFSQQIVPLIEKSSLREDGLAWNKWDTNNFIVLSLEKDQGLLLRDSVERIRDSFMNSWGLNPEDSLFRCKIVCVPDRKTLDKLFNIGSPKCEVRNSSDGKVSACAIWIDYESIAMLPSLIGSVSVSVSPEKIPPVLQNGIVSLSIYPSRTREILGTPCSVDAKSVFGMTSEAWSSTKDKDMLNRKCALICLMLRKELGIDAFSDFAKSEQDEESIKRIFGFAGYGELSRTLDRYSLNLAEDIKNGRVPDGYLVP